MGDRAPIDRQRREEPWAAGQRRRQQRGLRERSDAHHDLHESIIMLSASPGCTLPGSRLPSTPRLLRCEPREVV
jgi:hypothetical protein